MNAFTSDARKYGQEAKFVEHARLEMENKLREIFLLHGMQVEIRYEAGEKLAPF
jgi:hypothetical protein